MYITTQFLLLTTMVLVVLTAGAALTHKRVERVALDVAHWVSCQVLNRVSRIIDGIDEAMEGGFKPGRLGMRWYYLNLRVEGIVWRFDAKVWNRMHLLVDDHSDCDEGAFVEYNEYR